MTLQELQQQTIAILGLGVNNRQLAKYFSAHKIRYNVVDNWAKPADLVGKLDNYQVVFRTPGLPYLSPALQQAAQNKVKIYSQTKLFFDWCPAPILGVTGTKGKGTTATLLSRLLASGGKKVWLAGNIGQDPFEFLDQIGSQDLVVLELSSFQLQDLHKSPHIAVVLRLTPEHLDYHSTIEEYLDAKKPIVAHQTARDFAVLNYDQALTRNFAPLTPGKIFWNSIAQNVAPGCFVDREQIFVNLGRGREAVMPVSEVKLLGRFNLENVTAAISAAAAAGVGDWVAVRKSVAAFTGLPHRLELIAEVAGVKFYNDSFATTPETTIAALSAFAGPVILIVGGSDKKADYQNLAQAIARAPVKALLPVGVTGPKIAKLARAAGFPGRIADRPFADMAEIVAAANEVASPGDMVLLSPAAASFDMFKNYKHRGELFAKFVRRL